MRWDDLAQPLFLLILTGIHSQRSSYAAVVFSLPELPDVELYHLPELPCYNAKTRESSIRKTC
jgi:hypothetical protein